MKADEIDRILGSEELIVPASGFAALVMEAIRTEAGASAPIEFPWKKALPGIVVAGVAVAAVLALAILVIARPGWGVAGSGLSVSQSAWVSEALQWAARFGTGCMGAAWALTLASLLFGLRMAFPRR